MTYASGMPSQGEPIDAPLTGHTRRVNSVALGRVGDRDIIVSGSDDDTVRLRDTTAGQPIGHLTAGHAQTVDAVAAGRAGDRDIIVSCSGPDRNVSIWDAVTGQ
jgi:WD40 repeat protein